VGFGFEFRVPGFGTILVRIWRISDLRRWCKGGSVLGGGGEVALARGVPRASSGGRRLGAKGSKCDREQAGSGGAPPASSRSRQHPYPYLSPVPSPVRELACSLHTRGSFSHETPECRSFSHETPECRLLPGRLPRSGFRDEPQPNPVRIWSWSRIGFRVPRSGISRVPPEQA